MQITVTKRLKCWSGPTQSSANVPIHYAKHLFANILGSLQCSDLHKILVAPRTWKLVVTPRIIDREQRQVVAFRLMKFGFLLIGKSLLVLDDRRQSVKLLSHDN